MAAGFAAGLGVRARAPGGIEVNSKRPPVMRGCLAALGAAAVLGAALALLWTRPVVKSM